MFFHEQLDKTWGCSEGPGDNIQYKFGERAVPLLPQTTKQHWHPEAQKLLEASRARGEGEDRSDTAWEGSFNGLTGRKQCLGQNCSSEADTAPSTCKSLSQASQKPLEDLDERNDTGSRCGQRGIVNH